MSIVPESRLDKIQFYENHLAPWSANAAEIGLVPATVTSFAARVTAARAAYDAAEVARQSSKVATQAFYLAVREMHSEPGGGQDLIDTIRAFALSKGDPNIFNLAEIPPPATPGTLPPPGTPTNFTVELQPTGAILLKWRCENPVGASGTVYEVLRQSSGGSMTYAGATGSREFLDASLPFDGSPVVYRVTAIRSTLRGVPAEFTVKFGIGGPGSSFSVTGVSEGVKLAA